MSIKKKAMCIDLDTEDNIYHLKVIFTHRHNLDTYSWTHCYSVSSPCQHLRALSLISCDCCIQRQGILSDFDPTGEVSGAVWGVGVKAASSPRVSAERDCHVSPWEAPFPPPCRVFPLTQWHPEKSKFCLFQPFFLEEKRLFCGCHAACLTSVFFSNSELLLPSRHQSNRLRSAPGCTPQRTWTSAAKVGCCLVVFLILLAFLIVSWPVNLPFLQFFFQWIFYIGHCGPRPL